MKIKKSQLRKIIKESLNEIKTVPSRWWEYDPDEVMADIYWQRRQIPPTDPKEKEEQWQSIKAQLEKRYPVTESVIGEGWADAGVDLVQFIIDNIQAESNPTGAADWDTDELYEFLEKEGWTEEEIDFAVEDPRVGKYFDKLEGLYSAKQGSLEDYKQHPEWFN